MEGRSTTHHLPRADPFSATYGGPIHYPPPMEGRSTIRHLSRADPLSATYGGPIHYPPLTEGRSILRHLWRADPLSATYGGPIHYPPPMEGRSTIRHLWRADPLSTTYGRAGLEKANTSVKLSARFAGLGLCFLLDLDVHEESKVVHSYYTGIKLGTSSPNDSLLEKCTLQHAHSFSLLFSTVSAH